MEQLSTKAGPPARPGDEDVSLPERLAPLPSEQQERTPGLKIFDNGLYTFLTNTSVFAISVAATYLTSYGNKVGGRVGQWFFNRGTWFENKLTALGMSEKGARAAKMITFSFADGTVMAPVIKKIEDNRIPVARWIDRQLGTEPVDESVYEAEPNQTWSSVLSGRAVALAAVLPTAIMLGKIGTKEGGWIWNRVKNNPGFESLNDHLFTKPGQQLGQYIEKRPHLARYFGKLDIPAFMGVSIFEAFYTSLCTAGLYLSSRFIAAHQEEEEKLEERGKILTKMVRAKTSGEKPALPAPAADTAAKPNSLISLSGDLNPEKLAAQPALQIQ